MSNKYIMKNFSKVLLILLSGVEVATTKQLYPAKAHLDPLPQNLRVLQQEPLFSDESLRILYDRKEERKKHARIQSVVGAPSKEKDDTRNERNAPDAKTLKEEASQDTFGVDEGRWYDVVIVGAGWAGIAAAAHLQANNITNFKVLEGRDYIGGRSYTKENAWEDYDIDMGSMWLLYGSQNPLWELAIDTNVAMAPHQYLTTVASREENETIGVEDFTDLSSQVFDYGYTYYRFGKQYFVDYDEGLNVSASEALDLIEENSYYEPETKKLVLQASFQEYYELMYGARIEDMSLWYGVVGEEAYLGGYYAEDSDDHLLRGGFTTMIKALASPIENRIQTNSKVTAINYKDDKYAKIKYNDRSGTNVTNKTVYAKKVIVTVPLGVLSKNSEDGGIKFRPQLPSKTKKAIGRIGMGQMIKMFMFWDDDDIFWPGDYDDAEQYIEKDGIGSDFRLTIYNPSFNKTEVVPYLFTFMLGDEIEAIAKQYANTDESNYEKELTELVMPRLRNIFGDSVPYPKKVVATKWTEDEFAYGVYSYNKVGYMMNDRKRLRSPIDGKIFLGGEATSTHNYATVHGAYWSGIRAARKVVQALNTTTNEDAGDSLFG